jgi:hypothetical protein
MPRAPNAATDAVIDQPGGPPPSGPAASGLRGSPAATRQATIAEVAPALASLDARVAAEPPAQPGEVATFLLPGWALDEAARRLMARGLIALPAEDPGHRWSLVRIAGGRTVDRVELLAASSGGSASGQTGLGGGRGHCRVTFSADDPHAAPAHAQALAASMGAIGFPAQQAGGLVTIGSGGRARHRRGRADLHFHLVTGPPTPASSPVPSTPGSPAGSVEIDASSPAAAREQVLRWVLSEWLGDPPAPREQNAAWRILLPADPPGPVALIDLDAGTATGLARAYPGAVVLTRRITGGAPGRQVLWDGRRLPVDASALGLAVADERSLERGALSGLRPGRQAAVVASRSPHDVALYPRPEALETLVWPRSPSASGSLRRRAGELCAATPAWRLLNRAGLAIDVGAAGRSLAAEVLEALSEATGRAGRPVRCYASTGDVAVLRVHLDGARDAGVRIALTAAGENRIARHRAAVEALGGAPDPASPGDITRHLPVNLAAGTAAGHAWTAETWHRGRAGPGGRDWREGGRGWPLATAFASLLAMGSPTGTIAPGWAGRWAVPLETFGLEVAGQIGDGLAPLDTCGAATAWCHGDLWPGNLILGGRSAPIGVVDWEQALPAAPIGIDAVFLGISRRSLTGRIPFGAVCAHLLDGRFALEAPAVPGWDWAACGAGVQRGLVLAAFVLQATARDRGDLAWGRRNLDPVLLSLRRPPRPGVRLIVQAPGA